MTDRQLFERFIREGRVIDFTHGRKIYQWGKARLVHWFHPLAGYYKTLETRYHFRRLNA